MTAPQQLSELQESVLISNRPRGTQAVYFQGRLVGFYAEKLIGNDAFNLAGINIGRFPSRKDCERALFAQMDGAP